MSRLAILGAGAYGTALAIIAARAGREVVLWGRDPAQIDEINSTRTNRKYLTNTNIPDKVRATSELTFAIADAPVLLLAVPTQNLRTAAAAIAPLVREGTPVVAAAKGIEQVSDRFVTEVLAEALPQARAAILSGPSFAADMARGLPTAVTLAAYDLALAEHLAAAIAGPGFRIYHTDDVRGVEIGGAAKNVLAIAAGIVAGAGLGESARAAVIARGFAELRRLATALSARPETLMGLSGLGDLVLTASSPQSRNFAFGEALGKGRTPAELMAGGKLAEGAFTAPALVDMAKKRGVEMPISEAVAAVLAGRVSIRAAIAALIERPQKQE
jgi:glycerol-3-phosphate dehydrogenase (NAD(P)+)